MRHFKIIFRQGNAGYHRSPEYIWAYEYRVEGSVYVFRVGDNWVNPTTIFEVDRVEVE
jgi:hypothetical protein